MKVVMQGQTAFGGAGTNENVLTGQRYERAPFDAIGTLYTCGSAAGLTAELNTGGRSITPPTVVNAQSRLPVVPDDMLVSDWEVARGDLIQVRVVATGALTIFWRVELEEAVYAE